MDESVDNRDVLRNDYDQFLGDFWSILSKKANIWDWGVDRCAVAFVRTHVWFYDVYHAPVYTTVCIMVYYTYSYGLKY
jgi:hypothetical protein